MIAVGTAMTAAHAAIFAHVGVLLESDAGGVAPAEVLQQFAVSTDLSVDDEDMIEHVLKATCRLSIEPVSGAGAEVAQRLDQRLDGMGQGEWLTGDPVQVVRFVRGFIAKQALGGSKEGRLNLTRGRGQVVVDGGHDGVDDLEGARLFRGHELKPPSRPLQRVAALLADGDDECLSEEHHDPGNLKMSRRIL